MTLSRWFRHAATVGALAALPGAAQAQVHSDGAMTAWSASVIINPYGCSSGSGASVNGGGNPGSWWAISHYDCGTLIGLGNLSTFSWNPFTQGAITSPITFAYDGLKVTGGAMAFEAFITQGGRSFMAPSSYGLAWQGLGWTALGGTVSTGDWCEVGTIWGPPNSYQCLGGVPDFSSTGGTIGFGVMSLNSGSYGQAGGLDNFSVDFQSAAPSTVAPEPASIALVASGLVGIGFVGRRRRRS
ncbi:MAG: PEP-CTERM sorting domain-containing protein [Gemmatimonadetes bacterium]|nr:PEP-CTERM sorting domain-containing protein [Gemmatimonadota bacterium]